MQGHVRKRGQLQSGVRSWCADELWCWRSAGITLIWVTPELPSRGSCRLMLPQEAGQAPSTAHPLPGRAADSTRSHISQPSPSPWIAVPLWCAGTQHSHSSSLVPEIRLVTPLQDANGRHLLFSKGTLTPAWARAHWKTLMNKCHCANPEAGAGWTAAPFRVSLPLPPWAEKHRAKSCKEGHSHTPPCCLSCTTSFPLSAIKNSHKTQFIVLQYAPFPSLGLVCTLKVVFSQANWDDYQFFHGTPHAKLFIAQGLYYTHLPARMWNYWSELSFFFPCTHQPPSERNPTTQCFAVFIFL